ncbi:MAG: hypothetical protein RM021_029870 [Nostoc sp. EkiNYC01]|nr:hypothetical protein [Nostoc sp. EkiNYC01]
MRQEAPKNWRIQDRSWVRLAICLVWAIVLNGELQRLMAVILIITNLK